jgi:hypothetical protein
MNANCNFTFQSLSSTRIALRLIAIFLLSIFIHPVAAQKEVGFFSIVNAVGLPTNTIVTVDGRPLRTDGLKPGQATGGLGLLAGSHNIGVANGDFKPATLALPLNPGSSPILIIYCVEGGYQGGKLVRELKLLLRPNRAESSKGFSAIYVGKKPFVSVAFNGQLQTLQALREISVGSANDRALTVSENNQPLADFRPEEQGNYLVVVYDTPDSKLGAVVIRDVIRRVGG